MRDTSLADAVTRWYAVNARDLPWRGTTVSPWGVLVSEVMLQQTQAARVDAPWRAWMSRWPTPAALAAETPGEVIRAWGRLGYPRRALRLHSCAVAIVDRHAGVVPGTVAALLALPGIGAYTARAVAAFAFQQRQPVVDTNVRRVVARAVLGRANGGATTTMADLAAVEVLLPDDEAAAARASVALMELGALVCGARSPRCSECPLWTCCAWRLAGAPTGAATAAPSRPVQRYVGTDRHVRGLLLAVLREHTAPVAAARLDIVWPDAQQRTRALAGLVSDGLAWHVNGTYALPGTHRPD